MFEHLLRAFEVFSNGIHALDWYWKLWIYTMVLINGVIPLFFLPKFTSIIVLVSAVSGFFSGLVLTHALGYSKILGLMHLPWIPMVSFQFYYFYKQKFKAKSLHDYWLILSLTISLLSLLMDFYDICEYINT